MFGTGRPGLVHSIPRTPTQSILESASSRLFPWSPIPDSHFSGRASSGWARSPSKAAAEAPALSPLGTSSREEENRAVSSSSPSDLIIQAGELIASQLLP